jgi:hypothetical protein
VLSVDFNLTIFSVQITKRNVIKSELLNYKLVFLIAHIAYVSIFSLELVSVYNLYDSGQLQRRHAMNHLRAISLIIVEFVSAVSETSGTNSTLTQLNPREELI